MHSSGGVFSAFMLPWGGASPPDSLLPPGSQAGNENQTVGCETLIHNSIDTHAAQRASHQQVSVCLMNKVASGV